jgi:hypothetical protein
MGNSFSEYNFLYNKGFSIIAPLHTKIENVYI